MSEYKNPHKHEIPNDLLIFILFSGSLNPYLGSVYPVGSTQGRPKVKPEGIAEGA